MHSHRERFMVEDQRDADDVTATSGGAPMLERASGERAHDGDAAGALSEGMRAYIVGYGGPVTADGANPLGAR